MDQDAKKTALRMIPYGIYVLTADDGKGNVAGATVNWVTQSAFAPPLVVVGVKTDSGAYGILKNTKAFTLNMLGKEHKGLAFTFFKPQTTRDWRSFGAFSAFTFVNLCVIAMFIRQRREHGGVVEPHDVRCHVGRHSHDCVSERTPFTQRPQGSGHATGLPRLAAGAAALLGLRRDSP